MMNFKIKPGVVWNLASLAITLAGAFVSGKADASNRAIMKAEIKEEVLKELANNVKGS